jgi:hypothetical protein
VGEGAGLERGCTPHVAARSWLTGLLHLRPLLPQVWDEVRCDLLELGGALLLLLAPAGSRLLARAGCWRLLTQPCGTCRYCSERCRRSRGTATETQ